MRMSTVEYKDRWQISQPSNHAMKQVTFMKWLPFTATYLIYDLSFNVIRQVQGDCPRGRS